MDRFSDWLKVARATENPEGDLVGDMRRDRKLPDHFESADRLSIYLLCRGACPEALEAVPGVWRRYESWRSRSYARVASRHGETR